MPSGAKDGDPGPKVEETGREGEGTMGMLTPAGYMLQEGKTEEC